MTYKAKQLNNSILGFLSKGLAPTQISLDFCPSLKANLFGFFFGVCILAK
jgi:hypothetical protein